MGKQEMRRQLAGLSFSEKIKILEKLRDRSLAFASARLERESTHESAKLEPKKSGGRGGGP